MEGVRTGRGACSRCSSWSLRAAQTPGWAGHSELCKIQESQTLPGGTVGRESVRNKMEQRSRDWVDTERRGQRGQSRRAPRPPAACPARPAFPRFSRCDPWNRQELRWSKPLPPCEVLSLHLTGRNTEIKHHFKKLFS